MAGFAALDSGDYETALERFERRSSGIPCAKRGGYSAGVVRAAAALENGQLDSAASASAALVAALPMMPNPSTARVCILGQRRERQEHRASATAIRLAPSGRASAGAPVDVLADDCRLAEAEREPIQARDAGIALRTDRVSARASCTNASRCLPQAATAFQDSERSAPWSAAIPSIWTGAVCSSTGRLRRRVAACTSALT